MNLNDITNPLFFNRAEISRHMTQWLITTPATSHESIITFAEAPTMNDFGYMRYNPKLFVDEESDMFLNSMWIDMWEQYREAVPKSPWFIAIACIYDIEVIGPDLHAISDEMVGFIAMEKWNYTLMGAPVAGVDGYYEMRGPWAQLHGAPGEHMLELAAPARRLLTLQG